MNMNEFNPRSLEYFQEIVDYEEKRMVTKKTVEVIINASDSHNLAQLIVEIDEDLPEHTYRHLEYGSRLVLTPLKQSANGRLLWSDLHYKQSNKPLMNKVVTIRIQPLDKDRTRIHFTCVEHGMIATQHYQRFIELKDSVLKLFPDFLVVSNSIDTAQEIPNQQDQQDQQLAVKEQTERKPNANTVRKLKDLSIRREDERKNGQILTAKIAACKRISITSKTVIEHAPELWEKWNYLDYKFLYHLPDHLKCVDKDKVGK